MHKTIYIDVDEEITSVIERIRREGAPDIFLVVPKNAMLTQGLLNLKLLKKEAEKLNKNVMLVTNDNQAAKVIERAGLVLQSKAPENQPTVTRAATTMKEETIKQQATDETVQTLNAMSQSAVNRQIGSTSFYDSAQNEINSILGDENTPDIPAAPSNELEENRPLVRPSVPPVKTELTPRDLRQELYGQRSTQPLRPPKPVSLADIPTRPDAPVRPEPPGRPEPMVRPVIPVPNRPQAAVAFHDVMKKVAIDDQNRKVKDKFGHVEDCQEPISIHQAIGTGGGWDERKAVDFFSGAKQEYQPEEKIIPPDATREPKQRSWKWVGWAIGVVLLIALFGGLGWIYAQYPKVTVTVQPIQKTSTVDFELVASVDAENASETTIPAKLEQIEVSKTVSFSSSGEKSAAGTSGKARGKVTIVNNFSSAPQTLVATTRVLSKEGKLFRLVNQTTVPGMSGNEGGKVEVEVIADQAGDDFNIGPSTFTIEGFKGTPKYEKFQVNSSTAMNAGSGASSDGIVKVITSKDLEMARQQTLDELERNMEADVQEKVGAGRKGLLDGAEKEITKTSASGKDGEVTPTFTYTITQRISLIVFAEQDVLAAAKAKLEAEKESGLVMKSVSPITYLKATTDSNKKQLAMQIQINGMFEATIDPENIKKGIAGKSESEMKSVLGSYKEMEKVEIDFTPSWLGRVPVAKKKIEVVVQK